MATKVIYSLLHRKENAHCDPIYCCAWTEINITGNPKDPPNDMIITGGLDAVIKIWSFKNNKLELFKRLIGHVMGILSIAVSYDGYTLASSSLDFKIIIWELPNGNQSHILNVCTSEVWQVVFSPAGKHILSGAHNGKLQISNIVNNFTETEMDTQKKFIISVAWSPSGKYIASGCVDGHVYVIDVVQEKLIHTIDAHTKTVRGIAFSRNSNQIVTASHDGFVKIFNVASANLQSSLNLNCWVLSVCFTDDGTRVAIAADNGSVTIAQANGLKVLYTFEGHSDTVWDVRCKPRSNKLVSVSKDKSINIYECPMLAKN